MSDVETSDFLPLSPKLFLDIVLCGQTDISISAELALSAYKNTQTLCVCVWLLCIVTAYVVPSTTYMSVFLCHHFLFVYCQQWMG